ncbi:hypothetical protein PULV_a2943 [Pseudoalteromonas ulvae UL12]|uniref:serine hydrolase domain-containing protein n=1 Tax=Pseudoalteromonas ulvae TaxID=107327 RepID=UPI00186BB19C|nr:serine hydrolase domain-containing protein [Pseudoalteromonas ulvae]MBE0362333.1 hypothetical protein [Pseudoalteromonas ulvae UL12]
MIKNKKLRNWVRAALGVSTLASLFFVPWILVWAWLLPLPATMQGQVDQAIAHGFDGMVVYVEQKGEPARFYTAGVRDRAQNIPADANGLFKIASIGKLYHAVAITQLVYEKQLSLTATLGDYFPELISRIEHAEHISLKNMVQHRSGIPNYTNYPNYWGNPALTYQGKLDLALDLPASFKPDQGYEYSNTNYLLLSELIRRTTGLTSQQYIKQHILQPLGLYHTFGSLRDVDLNDVMGGYYVGYQEDIKGNDYGSMLATVADVGVFLRALNDGSVFREGEQALYSSLYVYDHGGLLPGFQSQASYYKDIDTVVVQVINTTNLDGYDWNLSQIIHHRIYTILVRQSKK